MGRHKGGTNKKWSYEEKLRIVKRVLSLETSLSKVAQSENINPGLLHNWIVKYNDDGVDGLKNKRDYTYLKFVNKKNMTDLEKLEYENILLKIENERLKKGYEVRGGGKEKEFAIISKSNSKSSKK